MTPETASSGTLAGGFRPAGAEEWLTPLRFGLALAAFVVLAFPQVVLGWETFFLRDFGLFVQPLAHYQRECFWRGELPLWNPYNCCGVPFLAQWNTMPLYPPALIYLLFPLPWSLGAFDLAHLWFGGMGMYFLARHWTGNRLGASLAGVVFAFNGLTLNLLMWPSHEATLSWMPWVVLAVEQGWRHGGRKLILAGLAGALQMLAGGPETILLTWLVLLALLIAECGGAIFKPGAQKVIVRPAARMALRFGVLLLLVAALAAIQLLPFLDLAAHSQRQRGYADSTWSLPGRGWANFLVPMVFGSTWNQDVFFQYDQYWTSSYYFGVGPLLLALLAIWRIRDKRIWTLAVASVAAYVCALGNQTFIYGWIRRCVPQLTLMTYPVKFVTIIIFAAPLLGAFALGQISNTVKLGRGKQAEMKLLALGGALLAMIAAILVWAWRFPRPQDDLAATLWNGGGRAGFLLAAVALLVLLGWPKFARWHGWISLLLLGTVWLDLETHEPPQNPTLPPAIYTPGVIRRELALKPEPALGSARVMISSAADRAFNQLRPKDLKEGYLAKRLGYFSNCNLLDEAPKVNGFFSLYPREWAAIDSLLYNTTNRFPPLEDFLSVAHVTAPGEFTRWDTRPNFLPEATAGQRPLFLDDNSTLRALAARDFDARKFVLLPVQASALVSVTRQTDAHIISQRFSGENVDLEVEAKEPSLVVISQTFYHDWKASLDGRRSPLLRANYAFQAVQVPAGRHEIRLVYEDRALQAGAVISSLALVACMIGWFVAKRT